MLINHHWITDDRPSVLSLKEAKGRDGLDVIKTIAANNYRTFGMFLLHDENGQRIDFITRREGNMIESVVEGIVAEWLKQESTPRTYQYLIECLRKSGMGAFAEEFEDMTEKEIGQLIKW